MVFPLREINIVLKKNKFPPVQVAVILDKKQTYFWRGLIFFCASKDIKSIVIVNYVMWCCFKLVLTFILAIDNP